MSPRGIDGFAARLFILANPGIPYRNCKDAPTDSAKKSPVFVADKSLPTPGSGHPCFYERACHAVKQRQVLFRAGPAARRLPWEKKGKNFPERVMRGTGIVITVGILMYRRVGGMICCLVLKEVY